MSIHFGANQAVIRQTSVVKNINSMNLSKTRVQTYQHSFWGKPSSGNYSGGRGLVNFSLEPRDRDFYWINFGSHRRLSLSLVSLIRHGLWIPFKAGFFLVRKISTNAKFKYICLTHCAIINVWMLITCCAKGIDSCFHSTHIFRFILGV